LDTLCRGDEAAVTVGLLLEGLMLLNQHVGVAVEFLIPLDGSEIGGGEQRSHER